MKKLYKVLIWILVVSIVLIQFIPSPTPPNSEDQANDLIHREQVPNEIAELLINGCYDCHSEAVKYPWYSRVAPVSWLVARDVRIGREELNFSQWAQLSKRKKIRALTSIAEEIDEKEMPLPIYTIMHPEARLSDDQRSAIISWTDAFSTRILEE